MEEILTKEATSPQNAAAVSVKNGKPKKKKWKPVHWMCFGIALIPIVAFFIFNGMPVVLSFISMFTEMDDNMLDTMRWNNFLNFGTVFTDKSFWKAWGITIWLASAQFVTLAIALVIAVLLEKKTKGAKAMQVLFFIPYICSTVAIAIMWSWIFHGDKLGVLNSIFGSNIKWLNDESHPYRLTWCIYITILWQAPAYGIVMFKAALKNISPTLYEAADLDGANGFQKFWYITLPGIKSVTLFLVLAGITTGLGVFDSVLVLAPVQWTGVAGPENAGLTVNYFIYLRGVSDGDMEIAAVASWFLFAVTFAITYPIIKWRNKVSEEG